MKTPRSRSAMLRIAMATLFLGAGLMVATDFAEARAGRSGSFGSRGSRTWSTPAPTPTAPSAQTMQRSATQPGATTSAPRAPGAQPGGFFNRGGFMGGLMGGLLGAGLFGLLMGSGFFSGLGSLAGILGLLLQVALIFIVVRLVMGWLRSRNQPSYAGGRLDPMASGPMARDAFNGGTGAPQGAGGAADYRRGWVPIASPFLPQEGALVMPRLSRFPPLMMQVNSLPSALLRLA